MLMLGVTAVMVSLVTNILLLKGKDQQNKCSDRFREVTAQRSDRRGEVRLQVKCIQTHVEKEKNRFDVNSSSGTWQASI